MAAALSPAHLRFGGTYADFLHFDPDGVDDSALMKLDDAHVVDTSTYPAFADSKTLKYATLTGEKRLAFPCQISSSVFLSFFNFI